MMFYGDVIFKPPSVVSANACNPSGCITSPSAIEEQCAVSIHPVVVYRGILKKRDRSPNEHKNNATPKVLKFADISPNSVDQCSLSKRRKTKKVDPSIFKSRARREQCLISECSARMSAIQLADGRGLLQDPDDRETWGGSAVSANEDRRFPMLWLKDRVLTYTGSDPKEAWYANFTSKVPFSSMCREVAIGIAPGDKFQHVGEVPVPGEKGVSLLDIPISCSPVGTISKVAASPGLGRPSIARKAKRKRSKVKMWLVDSGCGHDLISKREVADSQLDQEQCDNPMGFNTANGSTVAHNVAPLYIDELNCNISPYVLPSTPAVVSMGKRCGHEGYSFIWMDGKCPYFITPDKKRIRLRVVGDIPYIAPGDPFCQPVRMKDLDPEEQASMPVVDMPLGDQPATPGSDTEGEDDGAVTPIPEEPSAEPDQVQPEPPEGDPDPDRPEEVPPPPEPVAGDDEVIRQRRDLRLEAKSLKHLLTHLPKNPYCDACTRGKMKSVKRFRGSFAANRHPERWGQLLTADHLVAKGKRMLSVSGHKDALVMKDLFSDVQHVAPVINKTAGPVAAALRHFAGENAAKVGCVYTDNSGELKKACRMMRVNREPSQPGVPQSNAKIERTNLDVLEGTRTALVQAGLPECFWSFAAPTYCFLRNTEYEGRQKGSRWAIAHGQGEFKGMRIPFGCEVIFNPSPTKKKDKRKKWGG